MPKERREFRLSQEHLEYIEKIKIENDLPTITKALEQIIDEHINGGSVDMKIAKTVADVLHEKWNKDFVRTKLAASIASRQTEVILEILNTFFNHFKPVESDKWFLVPTDKAEHGIVKAAKTVVKERIANNKQKFENNRKKGGVKDE